MSLKYASTMIIKPENHEDRNAIYALTQRAFKSMPFSNGSEAPIIDQLRKDGDLALSLVAIQEQQILAHIAFSEITLNGINAGWFGLGPVSVIPSRQKQGIGSQLINEGLSRIKQQGALGCVLIGNPSYYERFGFQSDGKLEYHDTPLPFVQWLSFGEEKASGVVNFAPAFEREQ